jgi:AraC-like DNA-binding protein
MRTPRRHGETAATPIAFVRAILLAYARYGRDPAAALRESRIPPGMLADPSARITARQMEAISAHAMQELDDEALGWFSRRLPWGTLGMLCRASLTAPDLGVALRRWFRHHRLVTDDLAIALEVEGGVATVALREGRDFGPLREFCLLSNLRFVHGYACWAVDSRISLLGVTFPFPRPAHGAVYPLLFPGPVAFDAPRASFRFDARYLELPQKRDDAAMRAMLQRALPLTVLQYRRDRLVVEQIRRVLGDDLLRVRGADEVARRLHVSTRSLYRHLRHEGATLQGIKDEVRRERAVRLLGQTREPVKSVARAAGFGSEKSFARAFKAWTGRSPRDFRRRATPP